MPADSSLHRPSNQRRDREINDPCVKERDMSMRCLNENSHDKGQCQLYFDNYKNCRKFWALIQSKRKREGIEPKLPPPEEREEVRQKYLPNTRSY